MTQAQLEIKLDYKAPLFLKTHNQQPPASDFASLKTKLFNQTFMDIYLS